MIRITALSGPHKGKTRVPPAGTDPHNLLHEFLVNGWEWRIDYSQATAEEAFVWGRQDLVVRCVRALGRGLPVRFMDKEYRGVESVGQLEDDIVASHRMITLESDDEDGVIISIHGWEQ